MRALASPERQAAATGSVPAGGLRGRGWPTGRGGPEVTAGIPQDHRRAPCQPSRVPAAVASAHLLFTETEQGHY